jgi:hypothetical protein
MRAVLAIVLLLSCGCQTSVRPTARPSEPRSDRPVTFTNQVVRIFQQRCQTCHRPGEVAPFSLTNYKDAHARRDDIRDAVQSRYMPPWKAVPGYGEFTDVRRLSDDEIALIDRWVSDGAPEGDPFTVPARTKDIYRCFTVPIRIPGEWRMIRASEVLPGNRKIVHHVQTFLDVTGRSVELDQAEPGPGYTCFGGPGFDSAGGLGGWAPGSIPLEIPSGVAWRIPPGARLVIQVHYNNPGDAPETDVTRIGLHFTSGPFDRRLFAARAFAWNFAIPAGALETSVVARTTLQENIDAIAVFAHMHLLGRRMVVTAHLPDGTQTPMLRIDDWDFEWQLRYSYKRPVPLPAGTRIEAECIYDNSAANLRNPSKPPRTVTSGFETTDEMCQATVLGTATLTRR